MADLVDLAKTPDEKAKEMRSWDSSATPDIPDYGYGLTIRLEHDQVKKLGLQDCEHDGSPLNLTAIGVITECSSNTYNGEVRKSMAIQIQKMAVSGKDDKKEDAVETLYGSGVATIDLNG